MLRLIGISAFLSNTSGSSGFIFGRVYIENWGDKIEILPAVVFSVNSIKSNV